METWLGNDLAFVRLPDGEMLLDRPKPPLAVFLDWDIRQISSGRRCRRAGEVLRLSHPARDQQGDEGEDNGEAGQTANSTIFVPWNQRGRESAGDSAQRAKRKPRWRERAQEMATAMTKPTNGTATAMVATARATKVQGTSRGTL